MTKQQILAIGLAIHHIEMTVDEKTAEKIKPYLDTIEKAVLEADDDNTLRHKATS